MILQRLTEHYDRLVESHPELPRMGFSRQKMGFCVVLERDGQLNQIALLRDEHDRPKEIVVPGQTKPSGSGINPGFLWDNTAYMLGFSAEPDKKERARKCFAAFRDLHLSKQDQISTPEFKAVCEFLRNWSPEKAEQTPTLKEISTGFGVFRIAGETHYVHEVVSRAPKAADESAAAVSDVLKRGMCLVTGAKNSAIARLHEPRIKGVTGAQSAGTLLVSFNEPAFCSYSKEQSFNAPVSAESAFKYANLLNLLLADKKHRVQLGDTTLVFWAERPNNLESCFSDLLGDDRLSGERAPGEDRARLDAVRLLLSQLRAGTCTAETEDENGAAFFILGLSPNNSRLAVRFWLETNVAEMKKRLGQHLRDCEIVADNRSYESPSIRQVVDSTGRAVRQNGRFRKFDTETVSPLLAGAIARAVLMGAAYPQALLATLLTRIRADGELPRTRVSAIKACLARNSRLRGNPLEVSVALDLTRTDAAYNCGRLFAVLEKLQDSATPGLNATIRDRYFSAASSTPASVFPRLLKLGSYHAAKLEHGSRIYYDKLLGSVVANLSSFPRHLTVEDQGLFVVGYFHQRQDLFKTKNAESKGEAQ